MAVVAENDPVESEESILRRIPENPQFYNPELLVPITPGAFRPTEADTDGLSVTRNLFCTPKQLAAKHRNPNRCFVARILVERVRALAIEVIPDPKPCPVPRGHALIPELFHDPARQKAEKRRLKEIQTELAMIAAEQIVFEPPGR